MRGAAAGAESEQIWLAAFKIEFENAEMERARGILAKARATLANERIWMKSALVERERGETEEVRQPVLYLVHEILDRDTLQDWHNRLSACGPLVWQACC